MSTTTTDAIRQIQGILTNLTPDGIWGPKTEDKLTALKICAQLDPSSEWPPVAQSPVPAPASPTAPVVSTGGASPLYFTDTVDLISPESTAQMTKLIGRVPPIVGRYVGSIYEYKHAQENGPAAAAGIRLLMIGDQTKRVGSSNAIGQIDGLSNAADVLSTFPTLSGEIYLALDCENDPPLSADYWTGWCIGLVNACKGTEVTFLPILYASEGAGESWAALMKAIAGGAPCFGVWSADYATTTANNLPIAPAWNPSKARMLLPDGSSPATPPVLAWQTGGGFQGTVYEPHDANMLNPATDSAAFLSRCILPSV